MAAQRVMGALKVDAEHRITNVEHLQFLTELIEARREFGVLRISVIVPENTRCPITSGHMQSVFSVGEEARSIMAPVDEN